MTTAVQLPDGATRDALGPTLIRLQEQGVANIIVADADLGKSTSARKFREAFPERFITFGVAEQNMISAAAGMSTMGQTVVASTFAVFMEHAFDQLRMSVAQPNLNVKIFASHSGVSAGEDGASAQSVEDVALVSSLVNFTVCAPADLQEAEAVVAAAAKADPLASVDTRTVLLHGLKRLSYDDGTNVTPEVVDDLDPVTTVALAELIMGLSRRAVEEGKGLSPTLPSSSEG